MIDPPLASDPSNNPLLIDPLASDPPNKSLLTDPLGVDPLFLVVSESYPLSSGMTPGPAPILLTTKYHNDVRTLPNTKNTIKCHVL